jgi:hypothetical protein
LRGSPPRSAEPASCAAETGRVVRVPAPPPSSTRCPVIPREVAHELRRFLLTTEGQLLFADLRGDDKLLTNKVLNGWYAELATAR